MFLLLVTLISLLVAVIMTVIAWHVSHEERRRSAARVAALTAEIQEPLSTAHDDAALFASRPTPIASEMFAAPATAHTSGRFAAVAAIGFIVFVSAVAVAVVLGRGTGHDEAAATEAAPAPAAAQAATPNPPEARPLELVALGHERDGDRLIVRGVIRNPSGAPEVDHLTAVVFLFNGEGGFLGSGRAAVESAALAPGGESPFVVTVRGAAGVARYRVSFRTDDRVMPHVDRRDQLQAKG